MQILKEVTEWPDNTPNHTYVLNDAGKCIGYYPDHNMDDYREIKKPISFYKTRRKFKKVKHA